ncbi:uncharacterized protein B0H64DRAFT_471548 [Chaetomium fimeti]|uniref:Myb-like domain-containing protein n=1 Tax=Chaetomium fimeti TaxID=1854472 RepID=A0AAE0HKH5_9PEZI|nr:hypothetical protein B0H64DRAFT_471548 [Chaetomium fimeti]
MSGRGRGRPASRSAQEPAAGSSRRSTRQQQQHQNMPQPEEPQQHGDSSEQQHEEHQPQDGQQLEHDLDPQLEDPMSAALYNQVIDPAISGPQDGGMPPPPVPSAKSVRGQAGPPFARRNTRRTSETPGSSSSMSIRSAPVTDAFSSQQEPHGTALNRPATGIMFEPPSHAPSTVSSATNDTPGREAARARLMTAMLSRLFTAADDFFMHLCSEQVDQETWEGEREGFKKAFEAYRTYYVRDDTEPVVNPTFVTDVMRLEKASLHWYKVVRVVSAANLVMLLGDTTPGNQESPLSLHALESNFPDCFIGEGSINADNAMNQQIIEQILMIRTQLTILRLKELAKSSGPFHPRLQVAGIWCDGDVSLESIEAFLGNNNDGLQLKPIAPAESEVAALARDRNAIPTRFGSICKMLPDQEVDGDSLDLSQFETLYPFPDFLDNLGNFTKTCFESIKLQLHQESVHSSATSRADSQIRSQLEADSIGQAFDRADLDVQPAFNMNSLRMLKQLEQQGASMYGDNHGLPPSSYPPAPRIPYPPGFSSPSHALGYGDPSQQSGFQPPGSIYAESAVQALGRKRQAQGEPSTGDGTAGPAGSPAKKTRVRRKKNVVPGVPEAAMGAPSTGAPGSAPVAPSQYPPLPGTQDEPDFDALSQRTREISAAARKVKEPQVRSGWVRRDILLLVKAVNTYQCKWSTIEKEIKAGTIPFERPRDQQALRDKARLLKQDFLKTDTLLPRGFDLVVLGKKEKEAVKSVGKNPDRKEEDVDENGQPINTEFSAEVMAPRGALLDQLPPVEPQPEQQQQPEPESQPEPQQAVPEQIAAA